MIYGRDKPLPYGFCLDLRADDIRPYAGAVRKIDKKAHGVLP